MSDTKETAEESAGGCCDPETMKKMFGKMQKGGAKGGGFPDCSEMMKNCCGPGTWPGGEKTEE